MLIIISDLHLGDGTCGKSISHSAFRLFSDRLKELAYSASWRDDGTYEPLKEINILLLGDILDPLHSTHWLEKSHGEPGGYVRPWTDQKDPAFAAMLHKITRDILRHNRHAIDIFFNITRGHSIFIPPAIANGQPDPVTQQLVEVKVNMFYMVGNHDWLYHLKGEAFDTIRQEIIDAFGLANPASPFPHAPEEVPEIAALLKRYKVYARHGDIHDSFNYVKAHGRDYAAMGDIVAIEVTNRFFAEIEKQMSNELPAGMLEKIKEMTNVRPISALWLWVSSILQQYNLSTAKHRKLKAIWDKIGKDFIALDVVNQRKRKYYLDYYDAIFWGFKLSQWTSSEGLNRLSIWLSKHISGNNLSMAKHALQEPAFIDNSARYIVYGHTHRHEIVPLDTIIEDNETQSVKQDNQLYLNSGTWHAYYDLALNRPASKRFVPYQTMSYLVFYRDNQRRGQRFETWQSTYS